jgi:hypothetical protein
MTHSIGLDPETSWSRGGVVRDVRMKTERRLIFVRI